ncbi:MAG: glucose-1-phosphate thymidylyltransferase RfbA [Hyphomicrobiales bacterium]
MKGIILAGGSGSRLLPMTLTASKHILPVYDKPLVYYPLALLMLGGIRDILVISSPRDLGHFKALFGSGAQWGLRFSYAEQPRPEGIAQALIIAEEFIGSDHCVLVLGDNIFYGHSLPELLSNAFQKTKGATVFVAPVADPQRYGVLEMDDDGKPISIEEKPTVPRSHWAVTGLYVYDSRAVAIAKSLRPSARGELEITAVNAAYIETSELNAVKLGRGFAWLDAGTPDSMLDAANFVATLEKRQGFKIAVPEEIALRLGYIDAAELARVIEERYRNCDYGQYLSGVLAQASGGAPKMAKRTR